MEDPRELLMAAPLVPYNGPKEIVIKDWLPNIAQRLFSLMEKAGTSDLANRWFQFTEWRAQQLEEFLMKKEDTLASSELLNMSEPPPGTPGNDVPSNPGSPVTPPGHHSAASSSSSSASGLQQAANLLASNIPAAAAASQQQQQQQPTPPPTTTPMVKQQHPTPTTAPIAKQQHPTPTTTPMVKQQQPTPTTRPVVEAQTISQPRAFQPLEAEAFQESRERFEARMQLLSQVSSKSLGAPKALGPYSQNPTSFQPQAMPNPKAMTALLQMQTATPKHAPPVPPWKSQRALPPENSSSSSSRPSMPIYDAPVPVPSQSNVNVRPFKFIPNPNNPAELRLRALKDKHNEREVQRRMRKKSALEEAAAAKANARTSTE